MSVGPWMIKLDGMRMLTDPVREVVGDVDGPLNQRGRGCLQDTQTGRGVGAGPCRSAHWLESKIVSDNRHNLPHAMAAWKKKHMKATALTNRDLDDPAG